MSGKGAFEQACELVADQIIEDTKKSLQYYMDNPMCCEEQSKLPTHTHTGKPDRRGHIYCKICGQWGGMRIP